MVSPAKAGATVRARKHTAMMQKPHRHFFFIIELSFLLLDVQAKRSGGTASQAVASRREQK
jgi:hypothetical protein